MDLIAVFETDMPGLKTRPPHDDLKLPASISKDARPCSTQSIFGAACEIS
jgi:hypothetical protein